eukprot:TRINITY_DN34490_c0_g1_i1.p1 TRINITY_DN34490_c0_g1~~TRINITY_DN34490_c0_g1_i1.p1  ORF type:complete len:408 (-),score=86.40 TRINITY_DN34490_c0_g1_i1:434-1561(-)
MEEATEVMLQCHERMLLAEAAWKQIPSQTKKQVRSLHGDIPEHLQFVVNAKEECLEAKKALKSAREERANAKEEARKASAPDPNSLRGVRLVKDALYQVRKSAESLPADPAALTVALDRAREVGASPQELWHFEELLTEMLNRNPFEVTFTSMSGAVTTMEVSGAQQVGAVKLDLAKRLGYESKYITLLHRGYVLSDESQSLHSCGVSRDRSDFTLLTLQDQVEHEFDAYGERSSDVIAAVETDLQSLGFFSSTFLSDTSMLDGWTKELIVQAISKGLLEASDGAHFILRVEDGEIPDAEVRAAVRRAAGGAEPLSGVDAKYLKKARERQDKLSNVRKELTPLLDETSRNRDYSMMIAADARQWVAHGAGASRPR